MIQEDLEDTPFEGLPRDKQRLEMLVASVSGNCRSDSVGMEKATSIRLNQFTYPAVKALTVLSGNSMNTIVNDMLEVAYSEIYSKLDVHGKNALDTHTSAIFHTWYTEELEKNNVKD